MAILAGFRSDQAINQLVGETDTNSSIAQKAIEKLEQSSLPKPPGKTGPEHIVIHAVVVFVSRSAPLRYPRWRTDP